MRISSRSLFPFAAALCVSVVGLGCNASDPTQPSDPATETYAPSLGVNLSAMTKISPDLYIQDMVVGTGATVVNNDSLTVVYAGYFVDGTSFDAGTAKFRVGKGDVITGWDLGLIGMKVGGKRRLVIGSSYAYGAQGFLSIPPHATLVFTTELTGKP